MNDRYSFHWLGIKAEGLIAVLFAMGAFLHFTKIIYPIGIATMILAVIFLIINIVISLEDKAKKLKREHWGY